ncbi:MAG: dolichol kinase [Synechococcus sp. SB0673_bin_10]|nr:dolichol kinase [Cyanobacteria bacterium MAG IRC1_bin_28]MXX09595.1 dolichol kinase [Synechococcus sp. SB0667_bin_8]MYG64430.1 dolichol kinase [Synechococcus sp. SB0675_bin_7]MYI71307.1 dolichol kinase [Synechococcus sp. SB0673_bin_10]MYK85943.1 dolichol kinase [Synechococcus sp. SB0669_bin_7]
MEPLQAFGIVAVAGWLALLATMAWLLRQWRPDQPEWSRKIVHLGAGLVLPMAWATNINRTVALAAAVLATILVAVNQRTRLLPGLESVNRRSYGTVAYGLSILLLLWWGWPHHAAIVVAAGLMMAFGDGLAGILGPAYPSPGWCVLGQRKSLLGTTCVALVATGVGWMLFGEHLSLTQLLVLGGVASALEQISVLGADNLLLPLGAAALLNQWLSP